MQVDDDRQLDRAIELLSDAGFRRDYVARMQEIIHKRFGPSAVAKCFVEQVLIGTLGQCLAEPSVRNGAESSGCDGFLESAGLIRSHRNYPSSSRYAKRRRARSEANSTR